MVNLAPGVTCTVCDGPVPPSREPRAACLDPECARAVNRTARLLIARRKRIQQERQPTRVCTRCNQERDKDEFPIRRRYDDGTISREARCGSCKVKDRQEWREQNRERDREIGRRADARYKAKVAASEEAAERHRLIRNERQRAWRKGRGREKNREAGQRYRDRLRNDPARLRARTEQRRITARIRRAERTGQPLAASTDRVDLETQARRIPNVASFPLAVAIERHIFRYEREHGINGDRVKDGALDRESLLKDSIGITPRTLFAWRTGERTSAYFNVADQITVALDANWWDVYDPVDWPRGAFSVTPGRDVLAAIDAALGAQRSFEGHDAFEGE